mmetsp:Transcript_107612/g.337035  ORF Transcript_107612/g.337035 Transcript_107612/m.337035 type:complete len:230 (+) Transcript_107612:790-1479(+)
MASSRACSCSSKLSSKSSNWSLASSSAFIAFRTSAKRMSMSSASPTIWLLKTARLFASETQASMLAVAVLTHSSFSRILSLSSSMPKACAPTNVLEACCAADLKAWQSGLQYESASMVFGCTSSMAWQVASKTSPSKRAAFVSKKALAAASNAATLSAYGSVDWSLTLSLFGVLNLRVAPHLKASAPCSPKMLKPDWIIDSIWSFVVLGRTFFSFACKLSLKPSSSCWH